MDEIKRELDAAHARYNRREFVYPDPLAPVYRFDAAKDREIAGLIAAALAFGNVKQILRSIDGVMALLPSPHADLLAARPAAIRGALAGFRHRYAGGNEMAALLLGMRGVLEEYDSLGACFAAGVRRDEATLLPGLARFAARLREVSGLEKNYLLPAPELGSACKRYMMYLRWMVRRDAVDPGCWRELVPGRLSPARLVVPIDTHMHRIARGLGFTRRNAADLRTALEVTEAFRRYAPRDPVRYDFALTRMGILREQGLSEFWTACARKALERE